MAPNNSSKAIHGAILGKTPVSCYAIALVNFDHGTLRHWPNDTKAFDGGFVTGPLRLGGNDLGLSNDDTVWIEIVDAAGIRLITHSVPTILRYVDDFAPLDRLRILAGAATHYGIEDAYALCGADMRPLYDVWDVRDHTGKVWASGLRFHEAQQARATLEKQADWSGHIAIRMSRDFPGDRNWRHEGPLALLYHGLGLTSFTGIAVKSRAGRCAMMLEEVLWRFDQFSPADQAELMAGLSTHFGFEPPENSGRQIGGAA